jgi:hypothetical protein
MMGYFSSRECGCLYDCRGSDSDEIRSWIRRGKEREHGLRALHPLHLVNSLSHKAKVGSLNASLILMHSDKLSSTSVTGIGVYWLRFRAMAPSSRPVSEYGSSGPSYHTMIRRGETCGSIWRPVVPPGSPCVVGVFFPGHARVYNKKCPNQYCLVWKRSRESAAESSDISRTSTGKENAH